MMTSHLHPVIHDPFLVTTAIPWEPILQHSPSRRALVSILTIRPRGLCAFDVTTSSVVEDLDGYSFLFVHDSREPSTCPRVAGMHSKLTWIFKYWSTLARSSIGPNLNPFAVSAAFY